MGRAASRTSALPEGATVSCGPRPEAVSSPGYKLPTPKGTRLLPILHLYLTLTFFFFLSLRHKHCERSDPTLSLHGWTRSAPGCSEPSGPGPAPRLALTAAALRIQRPVSLSNPSEAFPGKSARDCTPCPERAGAGWGDCLVQAHEGGAGSVLAHRKHWQGCE